jgi:hypothetical protein
MKDKTYCQNCTTQINDCIHGYINNEDIISISTKDSCIIYDCDFCNEIVGCDICIQQNYESEMIQKCNYCSKLGLIIYHVSFYISMSFC